MSRSSASMAVSCVVLLSLSGLGSVALAQSSGGEFTITNSTIDNGGRRSTGGAFVVTGTIGQPDATETASGGEFQVTGGFWAKGTVTSPDDFMFSDGFEGP